MATFEAQISTQVHQTTKEEIKRMLKMDLEQAMVHEADVVRAALEKGLPIISKMTPAQRIKLYASIHNTP